MPEMRILYVVEGMGRGGAEKQLYLLLKHLDRQTFDPFVVSLSAGGPWGRAVRDLGVPLIEIERRTSFELGRLLHVFRIVRRIRPHILQTFLLYDHLYGSTAAILAGVPTVIASRRFDPYLDYRGVPHTLGRLLWHGADAIICNAEASRRHAPARLASRHVFIPNGVEPTPPGRTRAAVRESLGIPADAVAVVNVGRGVVSKNQRLFFQVAEDVLRTHPETYFLWVGGGPLEAELRRYVRERGLGDRVRLTGERPDVVDLLGAMDIFALTSDREGLSNATMEAMAAGLPCVVTDTGGNAELVEDGETGFLCPQGDRARLGRCVVRLIEDAALRRRFAVSSHARMQSEFSVARMVSETESLYRRLVGHPSGRLKRWSTDRAIPIATGAGS